MNGLSGAYPTVGYLTTRIGDNVSQALWSGVVDACRERGARLICFAGEILRDEAGLPSPANVVYDLVSPQTIDGLVSWASSLGGSLDHDGIAAFHRRYHPLPLVSITLPMPGVPTVSIDSYKGMRDIIAHPIEFHGYRRLAFIRGPEGHYYAQERYRAYADALQAHGIPLDPNLVTLPGDFVFSAGAAGMRLLLDERKLRPLIDFQAVVTVSDLPALGALQELQDRGIPVPEVVALAGFNDTPEGRFVTPPLTSVRLPFYEQGRRAVEMLLALLAGEQVSEQVVLPAKLRIRRSCGCLLPSVVRAAVHSAGAAANSAPLSFGSGTDAALVDGPSAPLAFRDSLRSGTPSVTDPVTGPTVADAQRESPAREDTLASAFASQRKSVLDAMVQAAEGSATVLSSDWADRLFDAFVVEVVGDPAEAGVFLRTLDHILRLVTSADGQVENWQNVVSVLRFLSRPCIGFDADPLSRAEDLWGQARVLIGEAAQRARGHEMVAARGPMTVAFWLVGVTPLLMGLVTTPDLVSSLLDTVTTTIIRWLHAQLDTLRQPEGILVLDDIVGMVSKRHYEAMIHPHLHRIFVEFDGLIRIYHNDTPCLHLAGSLAQAEFDVFNFSHETKIAEVKARMGHRVALIGNVPALDVGARWTPADAAR